ncbi:MAG: endonuclease NucS domain-containing protein [Candidatus Hodarchaeota archaeon]
MVNWIFIVTNKKYDNGTLTGEDIYQQRMKDSFWGIGEKTPNRKNLSKGDNVVFYIGAPSKIFAGQATLATPCLQMEEKDKEKYGHNNPYYTSDFGVLLEDIIIWEQPKSVIDLLPSLSFIENKQFWGTYFQGGVRQLSVEDYNTILGPSRTTISSPLLQDIENQNEFALEAHLEEFIYNNWNNIDWGANLRLFQTEDQDGRQFPAGPWSIDLLAVDKMNDDLVVIELKRGKTSDAVVGQTLRYISWIKENLAEENQHVRGIIIARKVDEALRYAVRGLNYVQIKTYQINFRLNSYNL